MTIQKHPNTQLPTLACSLKVSESILDLSFGIRCRTAIVYPVLSSLLLLVTFGSDVPTHLKNIFVESSARQDGLERVDNPSLKQDARTPRRLAERGYHF